MIKKKFNSVIFAIVCSSTLCCFWWKLSSSPAFQSLLVPGIAISIISEQQSFYAFRGLGANGKKVDSETSFQIASVSKTLYAWATLKWAKENHFSLDHPLKEIFSSLSTPLLSPFSEVTISQLLSHCSGISSIQYRGYPNPENCPDLYCSLSGSRGNNPRIKLIKEPGSSFAYSGGGYTLLEYLITQKELCSTLSFLNRYLDDSFHDFDLAKTPNYLEPHSVWGTSMNQRYFTEKAAAGLWASASTMSNFLKKILSDLGRDFLSEMIQSRKSGYGLGIEVEKMDFGNFCFHLGANPGWRSGIFFVPEKNLGLAVLTNSCSGQRVVMDNLKKWLSSNDLSLPQLYRRELSCRRIWLVASLLSFALFFYQLFKHVQINQTLRRKKARKSLSYLLVPTLLLSLAFFYLDSFPPKGWIVASFFPWEIHLFSLSLIFLVGLHFINHAINTIRDDR